MKKHFFCMMLICLFVELIKMQAIAYVGPTDNILVEEENVIYMVGGNYLSLLSLPSTVSDFDVIYKIDLKDNTKETIFNGVNARLDKLTLSPDYKYIAVIKSSGSFIKTNEMLIITRKEGKEVVTFKDDIRKYKWSPDGKKIIYIAGEDIEGRGLQSSGVWIYDLKKKEREKIADKATDLEWPANDNVYIVDYSRIRNKDGSEEIKHGTSKYSYKGGSIKEKNVKGEKFSLDGKYSILLMPQYGDITADDNAIRINIYDAKAEKIVPLDKLTNIFSEPIRIIWDSFFWVKGDRIVFEKSDMKSSVREILICDVENNEVLKSFKGKIVGINSDRSKIVVLNEGKFEAVAVP